MIEPSTSQEARHAEEPARVAPPRKMSRSAIIRDEVGRRFPDGDVPPEFRKEMSVSLGVSKQLVHYVLRDYDASEGTVRGKLRRCCKDCDAEPAKYMRYCNEHAFIPVECSSCGEVVLHSHSKVMHAARQSIKHKDDGRATLLLCSRNCYRDRGVALMKQRPDLRQSDVARLVGVTPPAVHTWRREMDKS